jgi:hypothetical protein
MKRQAKVQVLFLMVLAALTLGLVALGSAGCSVGVAGEYEVGGPPPPYQDDVVIASPGPGYVWIGGDYEWNGGRKAYAWRTGRWERPPSAHAQWQKGHYEMRNGHHYYQPGHWQK